MKKVSIVLPVYNMGASLKKCVASLLEQTYKNIEVIIINDGSKDSTKEICIELENKYKNIRSFHTENRGSGPARNYGIEKANGKYVFFMDADDYLNYEAISILVESIENTSSDIVVFGYDKIDTSGDKLLTKKYTNEVYTGEYVRANYEFFFDMNFKLGIQGPPWNKFFDLDKIKLNNIYYPSLKRHQDEVFISRYVGYSNRILFINDILYTHQINNLTARFEKFQLDYIEIVEKLYHSRQETILSWNPENIKVLELIYIEYMYNTLKSFDIIFSPKIKFNKKQRIRWIKENSNRVHINKDIISNIDYHNKYKIIQIKIFIYLLENKKYLRLYFMLKTRIILEKRLSAIMKFLKKKSIIKLNKN